MPSDSAQHDSCASAESLANYHRRRGDVARTPATLRVLRAPGHANDGAGRNGAYGGPVVRISRERGAKGRRYGPSAVERKARGENKR